MRQNTPPNVILKSLGEVLQRPAYALSANHWNVLHPAQRPIHQPNSDENLTKDESMAFATSDAPVEKGCAATSNSRHSIALSVLS
jgi:hypothetical protein